MQDSPRPAEDEGRDPGSRSSAAAAGVRDGAGADRVPVSNVFDKQTNRDVYDIADKAKGRQCPEKGQRGILLRQVGTLTGHPDACSGSSSPIFCLEHLLPRGHSAHG